MASPKNIIDFRTQPGLQTGNITVTYSGFFGNLSTTGKVFVGTDLIAGGNLIANGLIIRGINVSDGILTGNIAATTVSGNAIIADSITANVLVANTLVVNQGIAYVNDLFVRGDLTVDGNTVTVNTATLTVEDKNIVLANGAIDNTSADGAGITIAGANARITYNGSLDRFIVNKNTEFEGNLQVDGTLRIQGNIVGNVNFENSAFINNDPVITLNPLNQSIALLRAQLTAPLGNVLYVAGTGNDSNDGYSLATPLANIHTALARANAWTTVFVKSGDYVLYNQPVTIKARVGMVGDNLRTTTIRPSQNTVNMFYVQNASYVTGFTFRDHISPAAVFSYNPDGSAGFISTSPYIQNCSSITTTGTGMRVNGAFVSGLRSMVCDSYTQTNEGGIGIHMLNQGYTQLVSVFTICCDIAILCENGGFCSITNSNSSFGNFGLVARGVSQPVAYGKVKEVIDVENNEQRLVVHSLTKRPNYGDVFTVANYDQAKCLRDTKLIVDSLALDLAYQSNAQSTFAGLQYWAQSSSAIPGQSYETIAAFNYAKDLSTNVAANITITSPRQANVSQTSGTAGGWVTLISSGFDLVSNIITGGTVGVTDRIIPNGFPANTNVEINNSANLVLLNKQFIQKEVIAYVRQEFPGFFSNTSNNFLDPANAETKCERDVGYLLESITFDLRHGGNKQAIQSGVYYYTFSQTQTQINDQVVQTGLAYDYIRTLANSIVRNVVITNTYQNTVTQNTTAFPSASFTEAAIIGQDVQTIKNIVINGPNVAPAKEPIFYANLSANTNIINAAKTLLVNRDFIAAEVVAYVNQNWANISNGSATFFTVANSTTLSNVDGYSNVSYVTPLETITIGLIANSTVSFHQGSYISASAHAFEYIGSGTTLTTALPYNGGYPISGNQVQFSGGGQVYVTSTDQQGDFRIGSGLLFNRVDGTITGRTFDKSLFSVMTPYILAIEG
jgi:cytoskeletal protein CcmA (bactofilin family)